MPRHYTYCLIDDASTGDQARHAQAAQHPPGEGFLAVHYCRDEAATVGAGHVDWLMSKGFLFSGHEPIYFIEK